MRAIPISDSQREPARLLLLEVREAATAAAADSALSPTYCMLIGLGFQLEQNSSDPPVVSRASRECDSSLVPAAHCIRLHALVHFSDLLTSPPVRSYSIASARSTTLHTPLIPLISHVTSALRRPSKSEPLANKCGLEG